MNKPISLAAFLASDAQLQLGDFPNVYPHLRQNDTLFAELIYDYYCQQVESGHSSETCSRDLKAAFPHLRQKLQVMFELDQAFREDSPHVEIPSVGDEVFGFRLLNELGTGNLGKVFLATQPTLSNRPLVVKFSKTGAAEHLTLSRLQHTAIAPLLFAEEKDGLLILAMPFVGGCTVHDIMEAMSTLEPSQRTGKDIADVVRNHGEHFKWLCPVTPGPALRLIESLSYEKAICWIIASLAEGLQYAHDRDLVHLDVKPSNVLIAADGQPLLLDFHLAQNTTQLDCSELHSIGGTPAYMSPEQQETFLILEENRISSPVRPIDFRSDIYSLGLLMYDLLAGSAVVPTVNNCESPVRRARDVAIAHVSPPVNAILQEALSPDPDQRQSAAAELAQQLRKVAADEALEPNRSELEKSDEKRLPSLTGWVVPFLFGAVLAMSAQSLYFRATDQDTETRDETGHLSANLLAAELHEVVSRVRSSDILTSGSQTEVDSLRKVLEHILQHQQQISSSLDPNKFPEATQRFHNDLEDAKSILQNIRAPQPN